MKYFLIAVILIICLSQIERACAAPGNLKRVSVHDAQILNVTNYALKKYQENKHATVITCDITDAYASVFFGERYNIDTLIKYLPCDKKLKGVARICERVKPTVLSLRIDFTLRHGEPEPTIVFSKF